jgi:hypothetical protein
VRKKKNKEEYKKILNALQVSVAYTWILQGWMID